MAKRVADALDMFPNGRWRSTTMEIFGRRAETSCSFSPRPPIIRYLAKYSVFR